MTASLVRYRIPEQQLGQPLPHDLFNRGGVLVLQAGTVVADPVRLGKLAELELYRRAGHADPARTLPGEALGDLVARFGAATAEARAPDVGSLLDLADGLQELASEHPQVCIGLARQLTAGSRSRRQAAYTAALAAMVGAAMGLDRPAQATLIRAALTMNLASFELQDDLYREARTPRPEERRDLAHHPLRAAETLVRAGVDDVAWLDAVRQHHEDLDRTGYPLGIGAHAIATGARILRVADVYAALTSDRHTRTAYTPHQAMRHLFERGRGQFDDTAMMTLRRVLGRFPPGTLVRLANRETALVTRWYRDGGPPRYVLSILRPSGEPFPQPQVRDTRVRAAAIRSYTSLAASAALLDWTQVWGSAV